MNKVVWPGPGGDVCFVELVVVLYILCACTHWVSQFFVATGLYTDTRCVQHSWKSSICSFTG